MSSFLLPLTRGIKYIIIYILIITNLISMLNLHDDYKQPDDDSEQPRWDQIPDTQIQIVEITPDRSEPVLPESAEQSIIGDILNGTPEIFRLPDIKESDCVNGVN